VAAGPLSFTVMPVLLRAPAPESLLPVAGVRIGTTMAGIRKANRRDLVVFEFAPGTQLAGVFTTNRFCAAPVQICQRRPPAAPC
jgi:glutamate N-acetyltransferase / amino-acid N-acetyltransferase